MIYHSSDTFFQTDTLEYKLARFLVPILLDISQNKFKVQDSFTYVDEIIVI